MNIQQVIIKAAENGTKIDELVMTDATSDRVIERYGPISPRIKGPISEFRGIKCVVLETPGAVLAHAKQETAASRYVVILT